MAAKYFEEALRWTKEKGKTYSMKFNDRFSLRLMQNSIYKNILIITGYIVHHENHRKRFLYSPWAARDFLLGEGNNACIFNQNN